MKENSISYKTAKQETERLICEIEEITITHRAYTAECLRRVLKENEELNKNYNSLIDKIILKIDEYDYKFEKAKKQNKNDIADYYWDLIINFKKLLGGE